MSVDITEPNDLDGSWLDDYYQEQNVVDNSGDLELESSAAFLLLFSSSTDVEGGIPVKEYPNYTIECDAYVPDWNNVSDRAEFFSIGEVGSTEDIIDLGIESGDLRHWRATSAGQVASQSLPNNTAGWHHVALTQERVDSSTVRAKAYFDGTLFLDVSGDWSNADTSTFQLHIGNNFCFNDHHWHWFLTNVRFWEVVRTQDEIINNMNKNLSGSETDLVAIYRLDEGSGSTAYDDSGNGHNGTISNGTWTEVKSSGYPLASTVNLGEAIAVEADYTWKSVSFTNSLSNPIVITTLNTYNGGGGAVIGNIRNVTSSSFETRVAEFEDGNGIDSHTTLETIGCVALDLDIINNSVKYDIDGGVVTHSGYGSGNTVFVAFDATFTETPEVFVQIQNNSGSEEVNAQIINVDSSGFDLYLCGANSSDQDSCGDYGSKDVAWFAISNTRSFKELCEITSATTLDANTHTHTLTHRYSNPIGLASLRSNEGGQEPKIGRIKSISTTSISFGFCEHDSPDTCDDHSDEDVGVFIVEEGPLTMNGDGGGRISPPVSLDNIKTAASSEIAWSETVGENTDIEILTQLHTSETAPNESFNTFSKKYDFESGSFDSDWNIINSNFVIKSDNVYEGGYSAGIQVDNVDPVEWADISFSDEGKRISKFSFYYYETSNSTGGGFKFINTKGNFIFGAATDNPEWVFDDGYKIHEIDSGSDYLQWHYMEVVFNWDRGFADVYVKNMSTENEASDVIPFYNEFYIKKIVAVGYNGADWKDVDDKYMWIDNVYYEYEENVSWNAATSGNSIPEISQGDDLSGLFLWIKQKLNTYNQSSTPTLSSLSYSVTQDFYTKEPSSVNYTTATLVGQIDAFSVFDSTSSVDAWFEWGYANRDFSNTTASQTLSTNTTFSEQITGLIPNRQYKYRTVVDDNGTIIKKNTVYFTTPNIVTTKTPIDVTTKSAVLRGEILDMANRSSVYVWFKWGYDSDMRNRTQVQTLSSPQIFSETIDGLDKNSEFYYQAHVGYD